MSIDSIIVQGMVKPDGSLELDDKVQLPAGRVQVTIQPVAEPVARGEDWWENLQRAQAVLETRGTGFKTAEEIEAEREDFRSGDDRLDEVYRKLEERRQAGPKGC